METLFATVIGVKLFTERKGSNRMTKPLIAVYLLLSCFAFIPVAEAQTAADLAKKYPHHEVYEIAHGVQMRARFDPSGSICEMQVEPSHFDEGKVDLRDGIEQERIETIVDQLAPASERGEKTKDEIILCAGACGSVTEYSNVLVRTSFSRGTRLISIEWRSRKCD
jgi:hypothetical protein